MRKIIMATIAAGMLTVGTSFIKPAEAQRIIIGGGPGIAYNNRDVRRWNRYNNRQYRQFNRYYDSYGYYGSPRYNNRFYGGYPYGYALPPGYYSRNFSINPYGVYYRF